MPNRNNARPVVDGQMRCSPCGQWKPIDQFIIHRSRSKPDKEYRDTRCDLCRRHYYQRTRYGMSLEQFESLLAVGKCFACGSDGSESIGGLHVDHCHATGIVRGLLCQKCNHLVGFIEKAGRDRLTAVLEYISGKHAAIEPIYEPRYLKRSIPRTRRYRGLSKP